ncbi:hypothetical protein HDU89_006216 [Geranomyces variabilis]|nr:hypothetical protein HDU89_006216 [Geranomyces variabilis]
MEEAALVQAELIVKKAQRRGAAKAIQMEMPLLSMKGIMIVLKRHKYNIAECQEDSAKLKAEHKTYFRKFPKRSAKDSDEDEEDESEEEFDSDDDMPLDKRFPPGGGGAGGSGAAGQPISV